MKKSLVIGTRGSTLALAQTKLAADALQKMAPNLVIETSVITTTGDVNKSPIPLDTIGKSWFTAEIEDALASGTIDIAVHSLKDVPPEIKVGTLVLPILKRADPRDVFISKDGGPFSSLKQGAIVGTDSTRRQAQLLERRPDLKVQSIRGNVDTRLRKLREENYDAIVIAAAGLARLGRIGEVTEFFDAESFIPAPGQGVLAVQVRSDEPELLELIKRIQDADTVSAVEAERAFIEQVGAGCKSPTGAYATIEDRTLTLTGMIAEDKVIIRSHTGPVGDAAKIGKELGAALTAHV